jgi:hypothetical protein
VRQNREQQPHREIAYPSEPKHIVGGGSYAGAAYLVLGAVAGSVDLSVADAKLVGEEMADNAGINVSGAGDVDGDSHDDLLVGMGHTGRSPGPLEVYQAATYLAIGPVTGTLDLSRADVKLVGMRREHGGVDSAKGAGDVDGDGRDDVLIGAPGNDSSAATAYLIYGGGL